jgi:hypothetical protein
MLLHEDKGRSGPEAANGIQRAAAAAGTVQGLPSIMISRSWVNVSDAAKFISASQRAARVKLPLAKDIDDFQFDGTPINE